MSITEDEVSGMARKLQGKQFQAKGLKGALQKHLMHEKATQTEQKLLEALAQGQKDKTRSIKSGSTTKRQPVSLSQQKAFIPFGPSETLLLVGEGDFSYACSLVRQELILAENLIATGFDSEAEMHAKYPYSKKNVEFLEQSEASVRFGIDATNLIQSLKLKTGRKNTRASIFENGKRLNCIMFNFPHNGRGIKDMGRNIREHQKLVLAFFKSCEALFNVVNNRSNTTSLGYASVEDSVVQKIVISLFEGEPYISWGVKALARSVGYRVERSGAFDWLYFAGYHHRRTDSMKDTSKPASKRDARIYLFDKALSKEEYEQTTGKESKKDDSDEE